jgi:hypothetical protein
MDDAELKTLTFKVSADDAEAIDKAVRESGLSRSDYIRQRLLNPSKDKDKAALKASDDPVQLLHHVLYAVQRIISAQYQIPHLSGALTLEQLDTLAAHTGEKATTFLLNLDESLSKLDRRLATARAQRKAGQGAH